MPAWLFATALLTTPAGDGWTPAAAPPPTPWALAGARGWRICQDAERRAAAFRSGEGKRGKTDDDRQWSRHARQCPHAVEVLVAAAQAEILDAGKLFRELDTDDALEAEARGQQIDTITREHAQRVEQALGWLDAAIAESGRRGRRPPRESLYFRAYALTALGRIPEAREALRQVIEHGDVERWRSERMAALVELFAGNIQEALTRANRGVYDARADDQVISRYIRAMVLDRAGASAVAEAELRALSATAGATVLRSVTASVMPVHERLFFRALHNQANGLRSPALRFWQAYLARPEPEEPERVLARRHLDELTPSPPPADGP